MPEVEVDEVHETEEGESAGWAAVMLAVALVAAMVMWSWIQPEPEQARPNAAECVVVQEGERAEVPC